MFPLSCVLLPGELLPLHVFEQRYRTMVAHCLEQEPPVFGVVLIARGSEVGGGDVRTDTGTVASIETVARSGDGRYALLARGTERLRVVQWLPDDPYPLAVVELLDDGPAPTASSLEAAWSSVRRVEALVSELGGTPDSEGGRPAENDAWGPCRRLPLGPMDRQRLLAGGGAERRLELLVELAAAQSDDLVRLLSGG